MLRTGPKPGTGEPPSGPPFDLLRAGGQEAAIAGGRGDLGAVLVGVLIRLLSGPVEPLGLPVLLVLTVASSISASCAVRARLTALRALGEVRTRLGAPSIPGCPGCPSGRTLRCPSGCCIVRSAV